MLFRSATLGEDCDTDPELCNKVPVTSGDEISTDEVGSLQLVAFNSKTDLLIGTLGDPTKSIANLCNPDCMPDTNPYSGASVVDIPTNNTTSVALGDVNNDGELDLIAGQLGDVNRLHLSSDDVSFALGGDIQADIEATNAVVLGDVDEDGDLDLVVGNAGDGNRLYPNVCDGTCSIEDAIFGPALNVSLDLTNTADLALGDVDQDGDLDLVTGNGVFGAQPNRVYLNCLDAGCLANENVFGGIGIDMDISSDIANTKSIALGDLDGDGDLDVVAANDLTPSRVYENNCNGACAPIDPKDPNANIFSAVGGVMLDVGSATTVVLGDLDNDARANLDLVIGYADQPDRIFMNTTGASAPISFASGEKFGVDTDGDGNLDVDNTSDIGLADINGDGYLDIITAVDGVSRLYLNNGAGQFDNGIDRVDANTVVTGESSSVRAIATANVDDPMIDRDVDVVFGVVGAPNRLHLNAGAHIALLTVTDDDDETDTIAVTIVVQNNQPPRALFTADTGGGLTVSFDGSASDDLDPVGATPPNNGIVMFKWDFGDGEFAEETDAAIDHIYAIPGRYTVRLTVVDDGGVVTPLPGAMGSLSLVIDVIDVP